MGAIINNTFTAVSLTVLVAVFVVLLPIVDRTVCKKLGLNLQHGLSVNQKANSLLKLRSLVLYGVFAIYGIAFAFIVFFSRAESDAHRVHVALYEDLLLAFETDTGFLEIVRTIFRDGFWRGFRTSAC